MFCEQCVGGRECVCTFIADVVSWEVLEVGLGRVE